MMNRTGDVDRILADAANRAGLDDFGGSWFLGPLSAYAADLAQPNLRRLPTVGWGRRTLTNDDLQAPHLYWQP
jgi:hypothetical protein